MKSQELDWQGRRKPFNRRIAQDLRVLLPLVGVAICFGVAAIGIVAVESDATFGRAAGIAAVASPPPVAAGRPVEPSAEIAAVVARFGTPTPPAIVAGTAPATAEAERAAE